jgi:hypothetical protein
MRKTSNQILREIELSLALNHFEHRDKLNQCIDDLLNFRVNELEALIEAESLSKDNPILREWVMTKVVEHTRNICSILGVTVEGFKMSIEEMERKKIQYEQIRDRVKQQVSDKSKETMH